MTNFILQLDHVFILINNPTTVQCFLCLTNIRNFMDFNKQIGPLGHVVEETNVVERASESEKNAPPSTTNEKRYCIELDASGDLHIHSAIVETKSWIGLRLDEPGVCKVTHAYKPYLHCIVGETVSAVNGQRVTEGPLEFLQMINSCASKGDRQLTLTFASGKSVLCTRDDVNVSDVRT